MRSANPTPQLRRLSLGAGLLLALLPGWAAAQAGKVSQATVPPSACERLVQVAQALALAGPGTAGRYHCDAQQRTRTGQALALRYRGPEVADGSSNLVGYYEVDRGTQAVHAWDLATGKRAPGPLADGAQPPPTVVACGLAFELPVHYRITRPQRSESEGRTVCAFDVVAAKSKPVQVDCKGRREGGSPPYNVCDWAIGSDADRTTVRVAHTRIDRDRWGIDPFVYDNGAWRLPNAYADAAPAERIDFFGRPAYQGAVVSRLVWYRTRTKAYDAIYAGAGDARAVLVQLTPEVAVVLVSPPADDPAADVAECRIFCGSLRVAGRPDAAR